MHATSVRCKDQRIKKQLRPSVGVKTFDRKMLYIDTCSTLTLNTRISPQGNVRWNSNCPLNGNGSCPNNDPICLNRTKIGTTLNRNENIIKSKVKCHRGI